MSRKITVAALVLGVGCSAPVNKQPPVTDAFERPKLLVSVGKLVMAEHAIAVTQVGTLVMWSSQWSASPSDATKQQYARNAWNDLFKTWQKLEVLQVGPAGADRVRVGGQGMREGIYAWPTVSPCKVDQELVTNRFTEPGYLDAQLVNVVGLAAAEYVIFGTSTQNACPSTHAINANGTWAAMSADTLRARRAGYAAAVATQLQTRITALDLSWKPEGGNFASKLEHAGESGSEWASAQAALDDVFAALFYVDKQVKDLKLAVPAGISPDCGEPSCPERVESLHAKQSTAALIANLEMLDAVLFAEPGFDDFLDARNGTELKNTLRTRLDDAKTSTAAIDVDLVTALSTPQGVERVTNSHTAIREVTTLMKTQFVSVLGLKVPLEGAGDND